MLVIRKRLYRISYERRYKMSTLYWINVLDNLYSLCLILFVISLILGVAYFLVSLLCDEDEVSFNYKKIIKIRNRIYAILIISTLVITFVPTKNQLYMIYGVGGTLDYLKENPTAKELPDKCIKALDTWVDNFNKEADSSE